MGESELYYNRKYRNRIRGRCFAAALCFSQELGNPNMEEGKQTMKLSELPVGSTATIEVVGGQGVLAPPLSGYGADTGNRGNGGEIRAHGRSH